VYQDLVRRFNEHMELKRPPIGLAFVEDVPEGIERAPGHVSSTCTFWRFAEQGVFYATAEDHWSCPVGMMTMGFETPPVAQERAQRLVKSIRQVTSLADLENGGLPVVTKPHSHIVYGRLDQFPLVADLVLCIIDMRQAMQVSGSMEQVYWPQEKGQSAYTQPTCGVIASAMNAAMPSMSFGCVCARAYVGLGLTDVVLMLPAGKFATLVERLAPAVNTPPAPQNHRWLPRWFPLFARQ